MKLILLLCAAACWSLTDGERTCPPGQGFRYGHCTWYPCDCELCLEYQYTTDDTDQCQHCPNGYSNAGWGSTDSSCSKCRAGYYRHPSWGNCQICPKGNYSNTPEASSCTSCPPGQTTTFQGAWLSRFCKVV